MSALDRIEIRGFKSIRDMNLELGSLNILIGANGSGKTNFISTFELLNNIVEGNLQLFVAQSVGVDGLLYFGQKGARTEAIKYVLRVLGYIDDMPDGHWKQAFAKEVRDRYSGLLECMPRANLRNLVKEE